ncbi:MAG: acyltransferase family protein [Clostridia bacterium]|nr:acyltransferase family protein [Clostridia bacterium]
MEKTKLKKETSRILWIDVAKAIGAILVVLGHLWYVCSVPELNQAIYSFHVVLFFVLSGFLIKRKPGEDFWSFFKNKFIRLIIPTVFYIAITLPIYFKYQEPHSTREFLHLLFFVDGKLPFNYACWFPIVLFELLIMERMLKIKEQSLSIKLIMATIFVLMGYLVYTYKVPFLFGFDKAIICFAFLIGGMIAKEVIDKIKTKMQIKWWHIVCLMIVCGAIWYIFGVKLNQKVSIYYLKLRNYWYFLLSGMFGTMMICFFCRLVAPVLAFLRIVGQSSFFIVSTQYIPIFYFRKYAVEVGINKTTKCNLICLALTVGIVAVMTIVYLILRKIAPILVGERRKIKRKPSQV